MRRLLRPAFIGTMILLAMLILSVWSVSWYSPSAKHRVALAQGCLDVWITRSDPYDLGRRGFLVGGWSGGVLWWRPVLNPSASVWTMPPAPPSGSGSTIAYQRVGFWLMLPLVYPLALFALLTLMAWWSGRRALRRSKTACPSCGYDLTKVRGGVCPECGRTVSVT